MDGNHKFAIATNVISRKIGPELVILALESGTYFGLDPVGAQIWQLLEDGKSVGQICEVLLSEFDVAPEMLERDLLQLVRELQKKHLILAA